MRGIITHHNRCVKSGYRPFLTLWIRTLTPNTFLPLHSHRPRLPSRQFWRRRRGSRFSHPPKLSLWALPLSNPVSPWLGDLVHSCACAAAPGHGETFHLKKGRPVSFAHPLESEWHEHHPWSTSKHLFEEPRIKDDPCSTWSWSFYRHNIIWENKFTTEKHSRRIRVRTRFIITSFARWWLEGIWSKSWSWGMGRLVHIHIYTYIHPHIHACCMPYTGGSFALLVVYKCICTLSVKVFLK